MPSSWAPKLEVFDSLCFPRCITIHQIMRPGWIYLSITSHELAAYSLRVWGTQVLDMDMDIKMKCVTVAWAECVLFEATFNGLILKVRQMSQSSNRKCLLKHPPQLSTPASPKEVRWDSQTLQLKAGWAK